MAKGNFFTRLFGIDENNSTTARKQETRVENSETVTEESYGTTLQDAVNFVSELQSYYYNDICKLKADLVVKTFSQSEENFINKKIKQEEVALSQIDEILKLLEGNEREYQTIFGKSNYSFYDEIESCKLATVQKKAFKTILRLCVVNTKPELKGIILKRIEKYKEAWNIGEEIQIPTNYNVVLVEGNDGIETYQFGNFSKSVITSDNDKILSSKQLDGIRTMDFEFEKEIQTDTVWVYVSSVSRAQLNYMRRTCFIDNTWEYEPNQKDCLCFDVVRLPELQQYLKGILQIVLSKGKYAIISIVIPTNEMLRIIGPTKQRGNKVEICKKFHFYLRERSGLYKDNLLTARVNRRNIPEKLRFISFIKFRKIYF